MPVPALPRVYVENPEHRMVRVCLDEATYAEAITTFVIVCTDACIVNRARRTLWLARRAVKPMKGIWWIGGRRFAGEKPAESMYRCFKRETGLDLPGNRFQFVLIAEYLWKDRQQEPQDEGSHNLAHTFAVELDAAELAQARTGLERGEYDRDFGLQEFTREQLVMAGAHSVIIDFYDAVFPRAS